MRDQIQIKPFKQCYQKVQNLLRKMMLKTGW